VKRHAWIIPVVIAGGGGGLLVTHRRAERPPVAARVGPASLVGEPVCASCHPREAALWKGSHHQLAMQPANASTVLGDFRDVSFTYGGITSTLFQKHRKFMARTDGPDGKLHDYQITHTFGVAPLQQYLVAFPGGRFQALAIAWDSRPRAEGGQRWFHLQPGENVTSRDALHWTGATENWNYMCADCHSTNVRKSYDARTGTYVTRYSEMSVSCEACHGPGSRHVAWAREGRSEGGKGLTIALDERKGVTWERDAADKPRRNAPRASEREIEMCARCHSRRGILHEDDVHGQPLGDDYRVALLDDDLYYADGQIRGEVYEYGSFLQSRMYAEGVTCSDCHNPHRPSLAADDGVCLQCHATPTYSTAKHHFHRPGSPGSRCVDCHMPAKTYMVVDARRDHSFRVPRPDQSVKLGVPNACNVCHTERAATWAARTVEKWYGHVPSGHQQFAEALAAAREGAPGAQKQLAALVANRDQPAIARATALGHLAHNLTPTTLEPVRVALADPASMVRRAAALALADADLTARTQLLSPLLVDPVREVRMQSALALVGLVLSSELQKATAEYIETQKLASDRPEAHLNLALLHARQGDPERAEAELRRALEIDPAFVPAAVNLADLYRTTGRDEAAEPVLAEALQRVPDNPTLLYALGLLMVREKQMTRALDLLESAARGAPDNARYAYVHAIALDGQGARREAISELENVLARHPNDRQTLAALVAFLREEGQLRRALRYSERLEELEP
jgi:tetratricopeptide (TPR) repeat protein